jgi:hypothetical protein
MAVVLVVGLSLFLVLQVFFGENVVIFLISHTFQRLFEFGYCLVVIITHWRTFKRDGQLSKTTRTQSDGPPVSKTQTPSQDDENPSKLQANANIPVGEG